MTVRDMITRFHGLMDAMNQTFWDDDRSIALINMFKDKLAQEFAVNRTEQLYTFSSVKGQQAYEVPSTYVANEYLYFNSSYNREIKMMDGPRSVYGPASRVTTEGIPQRCYIWGVSGRRQLVIYPTFNTEGISISWWFYGWPPNVANDNDEPLLPLEWHPSIVEAMVSYQQSFDGQLSKADYLVEWENLVRKLKKMDSTLEITSRRGNQYGTVDDNFPKIKGNDLDFRVKFSGGSVA